MVRRIGLVIVLALVVVACGADNEGSQAIAPGREESGLVFRRADGSPVDMPGRPLVWCGPWNDVIPDHALHVAAIGEVERQPGEQWFTYWQLWAIPEDIASGAAVSFPGDYTFDDPSGVVLFVGDAETGNEASTTGEDSSGKVVFSRADCSVGSAVEFTIEAVVDSEFGDSEPITVKGTFRGIVGEPPAVAAG
jgi:hypothetical protein